MSKLDREIKAVLEDIEEQAKKLLPELFNILADDELSESERNTKVLEYLERAKPKTYDGYIADLKQVFREAGWREP